MKRKNKGFTLIELLAVIVILGIILAIVVTNVVKYIGEAKKGAFKDEEKKIARQVTNQIALKDLGQTDKVTCNSTSKCKEIYDINDSNYEMMVLEASGSYYLYLIGKGSYSNIKLTDADCSSNSSCNNNSIINVVKSDTTYNKTNQIANDAKKVTMDNILFEIKQKISEGFNNFYSTGQTIDKILGDDYKYMGNDLMIYFVVNKRKCTTGTWTYLKASNTKNTTFNYLGFDTYIKNSEEYCTTKQNISFCINNNGDNVEFSKPTCN